MDEKYIIYCIVFMAIFLPVLCWRRDEFVDRSIPAGDCSRLPGLFKLLWKPSYVLEPSVGSMFARFSPRAAKHYSDLSEIAALPLTGARVFVCKVICAILFGLFGSVFFLLPGTPEGVPEGAIIVLTLLGWMIPSMALGGVAQKRQEEIMRSLPFAIDLIGAAMRSGLEFGAAMRYYTNLGDTGALGDEFAHVLRDTSLGKPMVESLQDMASRLKLKTFSAFVGVVAYGTEIGASIADTLKVHGAEMRRERFSLAEQKAARAPALMIFPIAIFILPAVFLIIFVPVMLQFLATQANT